MSTKKTIIVTQKKSPIGRQSYQRKTLIGLGLNKIGRSKELDDTPSITVSYTHLTLPTSDLV